MTTPHTHKAQPPSQSHSQTNMQTTDRSSNQSREQELTQMAPLAQETVCSRKRRQRTKAFDSHGSVQMKNSLQQQTQCLKEIEGSSANLETPIDDQHVHCAHRFCRPFQPGNRLSLGYILQNPDQPEIAFGANKPLDGWFCVWGGAPFFVADKVKVVS